MAHHIKASLHAVEAGIRRRPVIVQRTKALMPQGFSRQPKVPWLRRVRRPSCLLYCPMRDELIVMSGQWCRKPERVGLDDAPRC